MAQPDPYNLQRFVDAQDGVIDAALAELRAGAKQTHWMWFVFPQLAGLGHSATAKFYAISSIEEARGYLEHPILGRRLHDCLAALQQWTGRRTATEILGTVDAMKLQSSLTLFDAAEPGSVFHVGLLNFFAGQRDEHSLALLHRQR